MTPRSLRAAAAAVLLCASALASGQGLSMAPVDSAPIDSGPREKAVIVLSAENSGAPLARLSVRASLPEGWMLLSAPEPFALGAGSSELLVLPVFIPMDASEGEYSLGFALGTAETPALAKVSVIVRVRASASARVLLLSRPATAKAGIPFRISFSVVNTGNAPATYLASGRSERGLPFSFDPPGSERLELAPGASASVAVAVTPPADIYERYDHRFTLTAALVTADGTPPAAEAVQASASSVTEVIPVISGKTKDTHVLPGAVTAKAFGALGDEPNIGGAAEVLVDGNLDGEGKHRIEIDLSKTVESKNDPLVNPQDRYYAVYSSDSVTAGLGDLDFFSTELTDGKRSGFGLLAQGKYRTPKAGTFGGGGYYFGNRLSQDAPPSAALYLDYFPPGFMERIAYGARAAMAADLGQDVTLGLKQTLRPLPRMDVSVEAAAGNFLNGEIGPAVLAESKGDWEAWFYQGSFSAASPLFTGPLSNLLDLQLTGGARFMDKRLIVSGAFRQTDRNLGALPSLDTDEIGTDALVDASYVFPSQRTALGAGTGIRYRKDTFTPSEYEEFAGRLRAGAKQALWKTASLGGYGEFWLGRDSVAAQAYLDHRYGLDFSIRPIEPLTANVSGTASIKTYLENAPATGDAVNLAASAGLSLSVDRLEAGLGVRNAYQLSGGDLSGYSFDAVVTGKYVFPWKHWAELSVGGGFGSGEGQDSFSFELKYSMPIGITMRHRIETGALKARVWNDATGEPLRDVIVRVGESAAVTDPGGVATFRVAKPGNYYVDVDRFSLPPGLIPRQRLPAEGGIQLEKEILVDLPLTPASSLKGRGRAFDFPTTIAGYSGQEKEAGSAELVERESAPPILVELRSGDDARLATADASGAFAFDELYSGAWTLRVIDGSMPAHHYAEQPAIEIEVGRGVEARVELKILPSKRVIQAMEDLGSVELKAEPDVKTPKPAPKASPEPVAPKPAAPPKKPAP